VTQRFLAGRGPFWNWRGARFVDDTNALLPRPPRPPTAAHYLLAVAHQVAQDVAARSRSYTTVPGGTWMTRSSAFRPWQLGRLAAARRLSARQCFAIDDLGEAVGAGDGADDDVTAVAAVAAVRVRLSGRTFSRRKLQQPEPAVAPFDENAQPIHKTPWTAHLGFVRCSCPLIISALVQRRARWGEYL